MLLLSREDIKKVFSIREAVEADKKAFTLVVEGKCDSPLRTKIQAPRYDGCFLFMPAYVEEMDTAALKTVNIFPHNIDNGLPTSPAQVLLIDGKTGVVTAVLDGTYVTQLRTGASSGVAFDMLAKKDCRIGALIGTGGQAATQLEAMIAVRELEEVRVFDLDGDGVQELILESVPGPMFLILHREKEEFYGWEQGYRGFEALQTNGVYIGSGGAGANSWMTIRFEDGNWVEQVLAEEDWAAYYLHGEAVEEDEFLKQVDEYWTGDVMGYSPTRTKDQ